jgi:glycosyltransferase involved in cell wall biosynthesis
LRVLHINDYETLGGAEVVMGQTLALLQEAGVEARAFTGRDLPSQRRTPLRYVASGLARRTLGAFLEQWRPQVIHLHNYYHLLSPAILAEIARYKARAQAQAQATVRVVMTAHDYHLICPNPGLRHFRRGRAEPADPARLVRWPYLMRRRWDERRLRSLLRLAQRWWNYTGAGDRRRVLDAVLCPSHYLLSNLAPARLRTVWLPNPVPPLPRATAPRSDGPLRLAFVGRIEPEKGLADFLKIWNPAPGQTLTVVGDGSQRIPSERLATQRGLGARVSFRGNLPHARALAEIAAAHALVVPSVWPENSPLVILEALSLGTNILVSDRGGMRELVDDTGIGHTFTPHDPASLALALNQLTQALDTRRLNDFDLTPFLADRAPARYLHRLLAIYEGRRPEPPMTGARSASPQGASACAS